MSYQTLVNYSKKRDAVAAAMDTAKLANGPGGGADMVDPQDREAPRKHGGRDAG